MKPFYQQQCGNSGSPARRQTAEITESKQGLCQDYKMSAGRLSGLWRDKCPPWVPSKCSSVRWLCWAWPWTPRLVKRSVVVMLWWGLKAAAWLIVQNTDYIKLTTFPSDRRIQQLQLRNVGSKAHRSLQLSSVQSWMDGPTVWIQFVHVWTGQPHRRQVRLQAHRIYLKPAAFITADVHLESTVVTENDTAWDSFSFLPLYSSSCWRLLLKPTWQMSSYLSPDWFLCFQARNIFNLCYKTKTNHEALFWM